MKKIVFKALIVLIAANLLVANKVHSQYNEVIQSIMSYCYDPAGPPSKAIDNNLSTSYFVHPYVACPDKNVYLHITLKRNIKAAAIRIVADNPGIRVSVGSILSYHTTLLTDETVYVVKPDQFQTITLYRSGYGSVYEISIEEYSLDGITMPFQYDATGKMTFRSIYLGQGPKSSAAMASVKEAEEEVLFEDVIDFNKILICPNPTRNEIKIEFGSVLLTENQAIAEVYSMSGTRLLASVIDGNKAVLNLSDQPSGTYLLIITVNNERSQWRIIKE